MMEILVFLVVTFGLLGIFVNNYISQYREIYLLWIEEIVFKGFTESCETLTTEKSKEDLKSEKIRLCSKVESYSREICAYANVIRLLVVLICIIALIALYVTRVNKEGNYYIYTAIQVLIFLMYIAIFFLLKYVDINIINPSDTCEIDEKLFDIWCKANCSSNKQDIFKKELQPVRMYEILANKINESEIQNLDDNLITNIINEEVRRKKEKIPKDSIYDLMKKDNKLKKRLCKNQERDKS
jgi:hypothetical protein